MILTLDTDNSLLQIAVVLLLSLLISVLAEVILTIDLLGRIWISPFAIVRYITIALLHVINIAAGRTLLKHDLEDWTSEHYSWSYIDEMTQNLKLSRMEGMS